MMDNTKLIAEARRIAALVPTSDAGVAFTGLVAALEAAEAELTRRDTVIARITEWRAGAEGRKLLGDPAAMDWPIDLYLAAAPVSDEAVKAETTTDASPALLRRLGADPDTPTKG